MKIARVFVASLMVVFGALAFLVGLLYAFGPEVKQTIEHSRQIEKSFHIASHYVVSFRKQNGRLPTRSMDKHISFHALQKSEGHAATDRFVS